MLARKASTSNNQTEPANSRSPLLCEKPCSSADLKPDDAVLAPLAISTAQRMAEFFSVLADANRLRVLSVLAEQELCVCDLAELVDMSESAVSHQLRLLRSMRVVRYRKQGRKVFYMLDDRHVLDMYNTVAEHLNEPTPSPEST
ncbi:MAG: ArsR/SmtB family transcription factor [Synechococcus sp.]